MSYQFTLWRLKETLLPAGGGLADDDLLRYYLTVDLAVAADVLQEQAAGGLPYEARLILDG